MKNGFTNLLGIVGSNSCSNPNNVDKKLHKKLGFKWLNIWIHRNLQILDSASLRLTTPNTRNSIDSGGLCGNKSNIMVPAYLVWGNIM